MDKDPLTLSFYVFIICIATLVIGISLGFWAGYTKTTKIAYLITDLTARLERIEHKIDYAVRIACINYCNDCAYLADPECVARCKIEAIEE